LKGPNGGDSHIKPEEFKWTDPSTGLQVGWDTKRFVNFPAMEWVLWFENQGKEDTPILQNIQDLDLHLNEPFAVPGKGNRNQQPYIVHGAYGGRYKRDDWWPFLRYVPSTVGVYPEYEDGRKLELGGAYPSSRRDLPFFNIETPKSRGVIVSVGWTGSWAGQITVDDSELTARFGLKETHFALHPGDRVRTTRILLLFWEGRRLHGQNMLRQLLHRHYIPKLKGEPQKPLVSVNTGFAYHGDGDFLSQANEKNLSPLIQPFAQLGTEVFVVDAGWYPGSEQMFGNWTYSKERYPRGFVPLSRPLKAANIDFGLWFAPEVVSHSCPVNLQGAGCKY